MEDEEVGKKKEIPKIDERRKKREGKRRMEERGE
jgi:hypothetical protein